MVGFFEDEPDYDWEEELGFNYGDEDPFENRDWSNEEWDTWYEDEQEEDD